MIAATTMGEPPAGYRVASVGSPTLHVSWASGRPVISLLYPTGDLETLSSTLSLRSRLHPRRALIGSSWPPYDFVTCAVSDREIVAQFWDPENPDEAQLLPWDLDREAVWEARYDRSRRRWHLRWLSAQTDP